MLQKCIDSKWVYRGKGPGGPLDPIGGWRDALPAQRTDRTYKGLSEQAS